MPENKNKYFEDWRETRPNYWNFIQMKHYYKKKEYFMLGQKKLTDAEYDKFVEYEEGKIAREVMREIQRMDKLDKLWSKEVN